MSASGRIPSMRASILAGSGLAMTSRLPNGLKAANSWYWIVPPITNTSQPQFRANWTKPESGETQNRDWFR